MIRPKLAALAVVVQTFSMAALFALALGLVGDDDPFDGSARDFAMVAAMHAVDAAVIAAVLLGWGRLSLVALGWSPPRDPPRDALLGVSGALIAAGIVALTGVLLGGGLLDVLGGFWDIPIRQRLLCALIGLGAAAIEESVFRGALQPVLVERLGRSLGIVAMAVIFSAYHLHFAPAGFLVKVAFGIVFGSLRQATGRNWAPAIAHAGVWAIVGFS